MVDKVNDMTVNKAVYTLFILFGMAVLSSGCKRPEPTQAYAVDINNKAWEQLDEYTWRMVDDERGVACYRWGGHMQCVKVDKTPQ